MFNLCQFCLLMIPRKSGGPGRQEMEASIPLTTDILIVGCGPVGATLALMLGRRGISTLVIDKAPEIYMAPRAIAFDFDALRILQSVGIGETDFEQVKIPFVRMISPIFGEFARINTGNEVDTHPMQITFYQPDLERTLRHRLAEIDSVTVNLATELVALKQNDEGVIATIRNADGILLEVHVRYLVGADGASSSVRSMIGQGFKGKSFIEDWLIIDAKNPSSPIDHVEFLCDPKRPTPHMVAPNGRQRWEFMLAKGESREKMEKEAEITRLLAPWGGIEAMEIERKAVYRFHARTAASFQSGRVFLIGDAAHITPPFIGQGLVSGLRDAANLSWKLAYVLLGQATSHILDSYDTERRPHSRAMINLARIMGRLIMPRNHLAAFASHGTIKLMRMIPKLRGLLEEQGMRPANGYRKGCFASSSRLFSPKPGYMLPQLRIVDGNGVEFRSDDLLGQNFALLGIDVQVNISLDEECERILKALSAQKLSISSPDRLPLSGFTFRGKTKTEWPFKRRRMVVLVRPDRIVMAICNARDVGSMLKAVEKQLWTGRS